MNKSESYNHANVGVLFKKLTSSVFSAYSSLVFSALHESGGYNELAKEYKRIARKILLSNIYLLFQKYLDLIKKTKDGHPLLETEDYLVKEIESLTLCHYTKYLSFKNMIETKELWFSSLKNMNDSDEGKYLGDYIRNVMLKEEGRLVKNVQDIIKYIYSFSFTTLEDDSSQWDRYGEKGNGICLVSNFTSLSHFFDTKVKASDFTPILYLPMSEKYEHNILLDAMAGTATANKQPGSEELVLALAEWSAFIKNESFQNESEFRIIWKPYSLVDSESQDSNIERSLMKNRQRILTFCPWSDCVSKDSNNEYLKMNLKMRMKELNLNEDPFSALFDKIIIGPRCEYSISEVKEFLKRNNVDNLDVEESKSTLIG